MMQVSQENHDMTLHEAMAARLNELLDCHFRTKADAAARLGAHPSRVSRLTNGHPAVWGGLVQLDEELRRAGIDPLVLLDVATSPHARNTPEGTEAGALLDSMSPQVRAFAIEMLRGLKEVDAAIPDGEDLADLQALRRANPRERRVMMLALRMRENGD